MFPERRHLALAIAAAGLLFHSASWADSPDQAASPAPSASGAAATGEPAQPAPGTSSGGGKPSSAAREPAGGEGASAGGKQPAEREPTGGAAPTGFGDLSFTSIDEPIVVEADRLEFDYENNQLVYRGSVHVVQGEFELESNNLIVSFERSDEPDNAELREVIAEGDVVITQGERRAFGRVAVFEQKSRKVVLLGNPVLKDGPNEVQGDRLTVYLDEGKGVVEAEPQKRVSAVLYPGQADPQASPSPSVGEKSREEAP